MAFTLRVESYSGYKGEESPRRFHLGNTALEVLEILDRWVGPDSDYFKLKASDGQIYILRHQRNAGESPWTLESFTREIPSV